MAKIGTYETGSHRGDEGFTLLELLVVFSIAAMIAMLAISVFSSVRDGADLQAGATDIAAALRLARSEAIRRNQPVAVTFDVNRRMVRLADDKSRQVSHTLSMTLFSARSEILSGAVGKIRFFPDGSSTGGAVTLAARDGAGPERRIDVGWLSGRVTVNR